MGVGGTGPEVIYAQMTSGNAATIRGLGEDAGDAMAKVRDSIELIRYAQDRPEWDSDEARRTYNMRAWATRASAEVCFNRLNRVKLSLELVADGYTHMEEQAGVQIDWFRAAKPHVVDAVGMLVLMYTAVNNLMVIRGNFSEALAQAQDFLDTDPFNTEQDEWLELGLVKSMLRDLDRGTMPGPIIPDSLTSGQDDRDWTPQGLGYDRASGNLLQTSYEKSEDPITHETVYYAQLSVIDPDTGEVINTVELGALKGDTPPNHAGGVSVHNGTVWVSSSDDPPRLVPYSLEKISSTLPNEVVKPSGDPQTVKGGATSTVSGNTMYVGTFSEDGPGEMYTYTWDESTREWGNESGPFEIPEKTQGIAVRGNEIVFSSSFGRDQGSQLSSYNLGSVTNGGELGAPLQTEHLPNMAEGVVMLPGGLVTTHESGATPYSTPGSSADPEDMWAGVSMTVTPYDALGLSGQVTVVPATLHAASTWFADAEDGLDRAESRVSRLNLPTSSVGEVPGAGAYVTCVDSYLETTATWLNESRFSSRTTANGLIAAANDYEETDHQVNQFFDFMQRFIS